jgi:hypothetical protein
MVGHHISSLEHVQHAVQLQAACRHASVWLKAGDKLVTLIEKLGGLEFKPGRGAARGAAERCTADPGPRLPDYKQKPGPRGLRRIISCRAAPGHVPSACNCCRICSVAVAKE